MYASELNEGKTCSKHMKSPTVKVCKSQRKTNYTQQNENSLDSLASNLSYN